MSDRTMPIEDDAPAVRSGPARRLAAVRSAVVEAFDGAAALDARRWNGEMPS